MLEEEVKELLRQGAWPMCFMEGTKVQSGLQNLVLGHCKVVFSEICLFSEK